MARSRKAQIRPPTLDYLTALWEEQKQLYSQQDEQIRRMRELREMRRPVSLPDHLRHVAIEVRDPTITDQINRVVAMMTVNEPTVRVRPTRASDASDENATLREKWTQAQFRESGRHGTGLPTYDRFVDGAIGDGGGWCKLVVDPDAWSDRYKLRPKQFKVPVPVDENDDENRDETPTEMVDYAAYHAATELAKKGAGTPFRWIACDVLNVYPVFHGNRVGEILEVSERPRSATFRQYRLVQQSGGAIVDDLIAEEVGEAQATGTMPKARTTVLCMEHWDETWASFVVLDQPGQAKTNGKIVKQWKHGYGRPPYFEAFGITFGYWRNRKVGWSIAESMRWLVEYLSFLRTLHAQAVARDTYTPIVREAAADAPRLIGQDGRPTSGPPEEVLAIGKVYRTDPGERLVPLIMPPVTQSLREEIAMVSEMIERLDAPRVRSDIGAGVEGAGFAIAQLMNEAKTRFMPIGQNIERALIEMTRFMWSLVRTKIKEDVWVFRNEGKDSGWVVMGPEDLTDDVDVSWAVSPSQPSADLMKARYWHERLQAQTAALDQAIEAMGDNPDEVRFMQQIDKLRQSPWYQQYVERRVLAQIGKGDLLTQSQEAEQMAQSGAVPPPEGGGAVSPDGIVPDMGNLALSPGGVGAAPATPAQVGLAPPNGSVVGAAQAPSFSENSALAGMQRLGP